MIRLTTRDKDITELAQRLSNETNLNPPAVSTASEDPYSETWAPYSKSKVLRKRTEDREETIKDVFETALNLSEDILEPRQET